MTAYTVAGGVASAGVGALLGWLGAALLPTRVGGVGVVIAVGVAVVTAAREVGWLAIPLPQVARQTHDFWARVFPGPIAAALWGVDLGLVFTTWLTFSGVWLLVTVSVLVGEPRFGAALFALHWAGRALSAWLAPLLVPDQTVTPDLMDEITGQRQLFRQIHVLGIVGAATVLLAWFARGIPL